MAGNNMGYLFGLLRFLKNSTVQFRNPAVQTYRRLRRIFLPEQYFREMLLEKVLAVAWSGTSRLMTRNYEKMNVCIWDTFWAAFSAEKSRYANVQNTYDL